MNDIFHTKEMKPPLLTCLTLSQHIQEVRYSSFDKTGCGFGSQTRQRTQGGILYTGPNRVSHMRRDAGGIFKRSGEIYADQYVWKNQTVTIVFGFILIFVLPV